MRPRNLSLRDVQAGCRSSGRYTNSRVFITKLSSSLFYWLELTRITLANNYMAELYSRYDGTKMLDITDINRQHFTQHGLNLRTRGTLQLVNLSFNHLAKMSPKFHNSVPSQVQRQECVHPILNLETQRFFHMTHSSRPSNNLCQEALVTPKDLRFRETARHQYR
ncbi:hypothetical protein J6590_062631 [Homalodisca vitripennis]|nr:hypothetical protein J6590_062631 [Homalodisca vitripennis]